MLLFLVAMTRQNMAKMVFVVTVLAHTLGRSNSKRNSAISTVAATRRHIEWFDFQRGRLIVHGGDGCAGQYYLTARKSDPTQ